MNSSHVTKWRFFFFFFVVKLVNSDIVTMGNGAHCKITDIENIRIKMFDGVFQTLYDVRHVPDVENNLISFGTCDAPPNGNIN
jgi:hypothetical protein